jgi:hypothetical protein
MIASACARELVAVVFLGFSHAVAAACSTLAASRVPSVARSHHREAEILSLRARP